MSFGFGGFGSNNNNQSTGFGGFGSNNNNNNSGGFGSNTNTGTGIFGASNNNTTTGSNMFGSNTQNSGSIFGGGGGFGANNNNNKTTFGSTPFGGSTTGGGLFGGASSGSTFGGFGANNNNNNTTTTTSAFGSNSNTGGGIFGQNKSTGFGSSTTGGGLFGGGNTSGGFGSTNNTTTNAFGAATGGFGANNNANQPNNGTASVPFNAVSEKDGTSNTATVQYQTITFQQPYQNYSLEELRLADYNQGRRYGNQNGQAGAFGQSTGFGGFGNNNSTTNTSSGFGASTNTGGLFGGANNNTTTTSAFGSNTGSAFGSNNNTGGGLFGQNKPATGGLFGSTNNATSTTGGGLFGGGSTTNTTGGFGASTGGFGTTNNNTSTGGGLFGASKPATGGLFGGTNTANTTSTGFGAATNNTNTFGSSTTGGLFGQNNNNQTSASPAFGAANTTTSTGGGLFGGSTGGGFGQNTQTSTQPSGGLFGGGFGQNNQNNQQKPGGLFGGSTTTNTTGGLFGSSTTNTNTTGGGLFGNSTTNANTTGGLFGQKPATTGNSLFGGSTTNTGQSGGLFGNLGTQNNQQSTGSGLFGGQNNQQKTGGLFGGSTATTNTGSGGLFGSLGQQNNNQSTLGSSLFQSQNQTQQNQQPNGNSLFGASGSSLLNTSMNTNPYGNDSLFANLATPTQSPGPIATPLSSSQKNKRSAILPQHKLNPSASTRLLTPQNKRPGGYGFTYSTYGTPATSSSQNSPALGGSLFAGGSLSRSLGKSLSTSNLRNSFTPETTSILSPGAFSTTGRGFGNGSLKRLNVNRSMQTRIPLFDEPSQKRVSFAGGENLNGNTNGETALVVRKDDGETSPRAIDDDTRSATPRPAAHQVNGNELARVSEDHALTPKSSSSVNIQPGQDPKPGEYWSSPSISQLKKMSKQELRSIPNFTVGRTNIGEIHFNEGKPVDISEVDLDKLFGDIVQLNPRNATVYGETCTCLPKPPLGSALNQPSEIVLANSWPRNKAGKKDVKHLERLKRVAGTTFRNYNTATGEWTFTVPHFSSYGLDYENDYSDEDDASSELSDAPDTLAQQLHRSSQMTSTPQDDSFDSPTQSQSSPDDTFDFKRGMRPKANVPGGFGNDTVDDEEDLHNAREQSFLGQRSVGSLDGLHDADYSEESESELAQDQSMADSESGPVQTTEQASAKDDSFKASQMPKSILKASQVLRPGMGTPSKVQPVFDDDWANQLQRTISPKKQDRQVLRESQGNALREHDENHFRLSQSLIGGGRPMTTAMDLMDSLFGETEKQKLSKRGGRGIELPYSKRPKTASELDQLTDTDKDFHNCSKPHFSEANILIYGSKGHANLERGAFLTAQEPLIGAVKDIRFMAMPTFQDSAPETILLQMQHTSISTSDNVPLASLRTDPAPMEFSDMSKAVSIDKPTGVHEQQAWQLLSLLFDDADKIPVGIQEAEFEIFKKEKLVEFWKQLVWDDAQRHAQQAASPEERALAHLSCNSVADACHSLLEGMDLRLATMVSQIGGDMAMRQSMLTQIEEWRRLDVLSEMEDTHRALYELLSGNCSQAEGKAGSGRENKASTFNISSRFALDWRRAFGLRLWYGIMHDEPIELAVAQFYDAVRDGKEDVKPVPWFVQEKTDMGWSDAQAENREDILWGILKLYAAPKVEGLKANVEEVLAPENVSGHPLNARLSFQLFQLFRSRLEDAKEADERKIDMPTVRDDDDGHRASFLSTRSTAGNDVQAEHPLEELGDKITLTYAASLHTAEHWTTAVWVYTHLSSPTMREHYIRSLLNQFSKTYSLDDSNATYKYLVQDLHVPTTWLHAAAALQAKSDGDALRQATHLMKAEEIEEAHEVLCRQVGPDAIISRDYDPLRELMDGFLLSEESKSSIRHREPVQGWAQGGQIYFDYIELIDLTGQRQPFRVDEEFDNHMQQLLTKLQRALEIVGRDRLETCGLEERVALMEIAGTVANLSAQNQNVNRSSLLKMPLTEDLWLKHSCELSANYYRGVMAEGR